MRDRARKCEWKRGAGVCALYPRNHVGPPGLNKGDKTGKKGQEQKGEGRDAERRQSEMSRVIYVAAKRTLRYTNVSYLVTIPAWAANPGPALAHDLTHARQVHGDHQGKIPARRQTVAALQLKRLSKVSSAEQKVCFVDQPPNRVGRTKLQLEAHWIGGYEGDPEQRRHQAGKGLVQISISQPSTRKLDTAMTQADAFRASPRGKPEKADDEKVTHGRKTERKEQGLSAYTKIQKGYDVLRHGANDGNADGIKLRVHGDTEGMVGTQMGSSSVCTATQRGWRECGRDGALCARRHRGDGGDVAGKKLRVHSDTERMMGTQMGLSSVCTATRREWWERRWD
ncbi:hypothetical protein BKA62DRAFT_676856 [Auriculariales sp. MPI-PUGE-AT-0066]|nr:hypothetical protein BKA62DRAFT_676856 [Auriculariales sp. MPI-PUGE-AT-0066]